MTKFLILLVCALAGFQSCSIQNQASPASKSPFVFMVSKGDTVPRVGDNISSMLQDRNHHYWFASNGDGVYFFDGSLIRHLTEKDGLCSNFVQTVQQDPNGLIWFTTRDGICCFDGASFVNYSEQIDEAPEGPLRYTPGSLFFTRRNGICLYNGFTFTSIYIHPESRATDHASQNRPYAVYCTLADRQGNLWFGTQERGVCRFDGNSFAFFNGNGLDKGAVRMLYQDAAGTLWAGNNGAGLFRFDGATFTNFTEEKGLGNPEFFTNLKGKEGTLARPWAMNQDAAGNLWIGTVDAGVWKLSGDSLLNFTTANGLGSNAVVVILRNDKGELLFSAEGAGIFRLNGSAFVKSEFQ